MPPSLALQAGCTSTVVPLPRSTAPVQIGVTSGDGYTWQVWERQNGTRYLLTPKTGRTVDVDDNFKADPIPLVGELVAVAHPI